MVKFKKFEPNPRWARALYLLGVVAALVVAAGADRKFD